jgi:hypothetical protein
VAVSNPAFNGTNAATVSRDFGFGATRGSGQVYLNGAALPIDSWSNGVIVARVPPGASTGQLEVLRGNGRRSVMGVTVTVSNTAPFAVVAPAAGAGVTHTSIQAAIDAAPQGALILVKPGTYKELVVMHKKVQLQGWGAWSTVIDAMKALPAENLQAWRNKVASLLAAGQFSLLPGQVPGFNPQTNQPSLFAFEEGPGILVVANTGEFNNTSAARIDGLMVTGASEGGGILVNGYANYLQISNNKIVGNSGIYGGGVRVGHPGLLNTATNDYTDAQNDNLNIHHNHIALNGGMNGVGGGVAMCNGADSYRVEFNYVCGNFSRGNGGGIAHLGRSNNGVINRNTVLLNQAFSAGVGSNGGGIFVGGLPAVTAGQLSAGTGTVDITANLIQGNHAATGDGGGIRLQYVNGRDVQAAPNNPLTWYRVRVDNNMLVNNVAGHAGGGISMQDVAASGRIGLDVITGASRLLHNTVAHNDSTATSIAAFAAGNQNQSTPQPAGIVSWNHSAALVTAMTNPAFRTTFSDPTVLNNIVWRNRSFYFFADLGVSPPTYGLVPNIGAGQAAVYNDFGVLGTAGALDPRYSLLTSTAGFHSSNFTGDPLFVGAYFNGNRALSITSPGTPSSMDTFAAFDEGGNFLMLQYGPLTPRGNYHLQDGSPAEARGFRVPILPPIATTDFDGESRPQPAGPLQPPDVGADERP